MNVGERTNPKLHVCQLTYIYFIAFKNLPLNCKELPLLKKEDTSYINWKLSKYLFINDFEILESFFSLINNLV